ncbi:PLDc N-terminal domain-containing protein [Corynebacterium sp. A21]|uniref:PLDc N-terminal domain-containing protein n=1 Tax=Corynebacterium sp. A21 TaxID=3457318 RepID=UPI003FD3C48C
MANEELPVESLPLEGGGDAILIPATYDIVWSIFLIFQLLIAVCVAVAERRRGASWVETFLWGALALLLPVAGLVIWALYRIVGKARPEAQPN